MKSAVLLGLAALVTLCTSVQFRPRPVEKQAEQAKDAATKTNKVTGPLTDHFSTWLNSNGYDTDDFRRLDYGTQGSYGGKKSDSDAVTHYPVVFIHGNSDAALRTSDAMSGWENSISYFLQKGYTTAELYATSWSDDNALNAASRTHSCEFVKRWRRFIQAVKDYTGAPYVNVITHSMGVTLGRKAIKGGPISAADGNCDIGKPLNFIDVYVGLSGANYGLCTCEGVGVASPTCNTKNGLWPGDYCGINYLDCGLTVMPFPCNGPVYSDFLTDLNSDVTLEAKRVVSGYSLSDDLILYANQVWGRPTSLIPRSTDHKVYNVYTHMETKELTADDQYAWVNRL